MTGGNLASARARCGRALEVFRRMHADRPTAATAVLLGVALGKVADLLYVIGFACICLVLVTISLWCLLLL